MRNIIGLAVVGLMASVSFANAASTGAAPTPVYGIRYYCEFEGRGLSEHGSQDRDVRCKVEGLLPIGIGAETADASARLINVGGPIEIKCSNDYRLETEYTALAYQGSNLWINAEKRDKLATLRIQEYSVAGAQENGKRYKADLIAANSSVIHGEGQCRFEFPSGPPAPPAPALAQ